jgi:hypothetical protein
LVVSLLKYFMNTSGDPCYLTLWSSDGHTARATMRESIISIQHAADTERRRDKIPKQTIIREHDVVEHTIDVDCDPLIRTSVNL